MRQQMLGRLLLASLALLSISGCRSDKPPVISIICLGDGFGGADCSLGANATAPAGCSASDPTQPTHVYCLPSALTNFWMTSEADESAWASWCYGSAPQASRAVLKTMRQEIRR